MVWRFFEHSQEPKALTYAKHMNGITIIWYLKEMSVSKTQ